MKIGTKRKKPFQITIATTKFVWINNKFCNSLENVVLPSSDWMDVHQIYYILIMDEKVLVLCEKWISKFSSNLYVLRPPESEEMVFTNVPVCPSVRLSVCLSVGRVRHNSRQNYQIELSFGTLYRSRESKDKFVNQPYPIKIEGLSTTFVFLKIIFWKNQKFQHWFLIVLINLYKLSW